MEKLTAVRNVLVSGNWHGFAASIPGSGHIRHGIPCQDASLALTSPRPSLIVCDGRGSARLSHLGAQGAVAAFKRQLAVMEPFLVRMLDGGTGAPEQWEKFCRILYRTLWQVQLDLADEHEVAAKEFDFTVALAVVGKTHIGCFQVGDGSIVLRQNGECRTAFLPEKGEFANQTHFLRTGGEIRQAFRQALFPTADNTGIAVTSDGPEHMMFRLADMAPGKVFDCFFDDLAQGELTWQDLMDYLTGREWNDDPRGADDRSVALLVPPNVPAPAEAPVAAEAPTPAEETPGTEVPAASPEETEEKPSSPPTAPRRRRRGRKPAAFSLALLLAAGTISGFGYGWRQRSHLRGAERTIQRQRSLIGEQNKKLATAEQEAAELRSELRRIDSENRSLREQVEDMSADDFPQDVE